MVRLLCAVILRIFLYQLYLLLFYLFFLGSRALRTRHNVPRDFIEAADELATDKVPPLVESLGRRDTLVLLSVDFGSDHLAPIGATVGLVQKLDLVLAFRQLVRFKELSESLITTSLYRLPSRSVPGLFKSLDKRIS